MPLRKLARKGLLAGGILAVLAPPCAAAETPNAPHGSPAAAVGTLRELGPALTACWHAPDGSTGSEVTVAFSLARSGALIGTPRITHSKLLGDATTRRAFVAAVLGAIADCLPIKVSPGLGGAIAGRPLTLRFIGGPAGVGL